MPANTKEAVIVTIMHQGIHLGYVIAIGRDFGKEYAGASTFTLSTSKGDFKFTDEQEYWFKGMAPASEINGGELTWLAVSMRKKNDGTPDEDKPLKQLEKYIGGLPQLNSNVAEFVSPVNPRVWADGEHFPSNMKVFHSFDEGKMEHWFVGIRYVGDSLEELSLGSSRSPCDVSQLPDYFAPKPEPSVNFINHLMDFTTDTSQLVSAYRHCKTE